MPGPFRVVHFTDVHIQPERGAPLGVQRALEAVHRLNPKVDAILLGGDTVMNSVSVDLNRARQQWDLWDQAIARYSDTRILACIGNQDCWGWNAKLSGCTAPRQRKPQAGDLCRYALTITYKIADSPGSVRETGTQTDTVSASSISGRACLLDTARLDTAMQGRKRTRFVKVWHLLSPLGQQELAHSIGDAKPLLVKSTSFLAPNDLRIGATVAGTTLYSDGSSARTQMEIPRGERIKVPAGTYDCLVISSSRTLKPSGNTLMTMEWWSPKLGHFVKSDTTQQSTITQGNRHLTTRLVLELTTADLKW